MQAKAADVRKTIDTRLWQIGRKGETIAVDGRGQNFLAALLAEIGGRDYLRRMAKRKTNKPIATIEEIDRSIHLIRGLRVMLDSDSAALYGVPTKRLNEQVSRNRDRFPEDFAYHLTAQEFADLRSQTATSRLVHGGRRTRPWEFTDQGVAMLSSVLNSPTAIRVNIEIMRAFVRIRRLMATPGELVEQITKLAQTVQLHDDEIKVIARVLQQMIEKPAEPSRQIGFHTKNNDPG